MTISYHWHNPMGMYLSEVPFKQPHIHKGLAVYVPQEPVSVSMPTAKTGENKRLRKHNKIIV